MNNNKVKVIGDIVNKFEFSHQINDEKFFRTFVSAKRTSGTEDVLPVVVSEKLIDTTVDIRGMRVEIIGSFRSRNHYYDGKSHLELYVWPSLIQCTQNDYENVIEMDGFVCKQPTLRDTPFGRQISDAIIAVNRRMGKTDYIPVLAWSRNAVFMAGLLIGTRVSIKGRIQSRDYYKKIGDELEQRTAYEVSITDMDLWGDEDGSSMAEKGILQ